MDADFEARFDEALDRLIAAERASIRKELSEAIAAEYEDLFTLASYEGEMVQAVRLGNIRAALDRICPEEPGASRAV